MPTLAQIVREMAAPVLLDGRVHDAPTARACIEALFAARTASEVLPVLSWFARPGLRGEWASYEAHAGGAWKPDPRDRDLARKATFAIAHRDRMKGRGLHALDAMRASVLAEWCVMAGLASRAQAIEAIAPVVRLALNSHASWEDYGEQLLLGLEFAEGSVDDELRSRLGARGQLAWTADVTDVEPSPAVAADATAGATLTLALRLALDCPTCHHPVLAPGPVEHWTCRVCGAGFDVSPAEWTAFFERDVPEIRRGGVDESPYGSDWGKRFFSRRMTAKVASTACACGAANHATEPRTLVCACGRSTRVRAADACALAIDPHARLVFEPLQRQRPVEPAATFTCAACGAEQPLEGEPSRVRTCITCNMHTCVDDAAHARSFDPPRWRTFYIVSAE